MDSRRHRALGFTWIEAVIVLVLLVAAAALLVPTMYHAHPQANGTRCSNNLRQLALGALQYGDDKGHFPHVTALDQLDGDFQDAGPAGTSRVLRALIWYGYTESPEGFICPSSFDTYQPVRNTATKGNMRLWFWGGAHTAGSATVSPFLDGLADPSIEVTDELSYGWTRKAMSINVRSTVFLGADRSVRIEADSLAGPPALAGLEGNHEDGWSVVHADASVERFKVGGNLPSPPPRLPADVLASTASPTDGFLSVRDQSSTLGSGS